VNIGVGGHIGIDAPEPRNNGTRPKSYFGAESTNYLRLLLKDKKVRLEYDVAKYDRYGRTLAYAYLEDGSFVNAEMVRNGFAIVMTVPPNVRHQATFNALATKARRQNTGLWK
jgi:micrococcal nuclease